MDHREQAGLFWNSLLHEAAKAGFGGDAEVSVALDRSRSYINTMKRRSGQPTLADAVGVMAVLPEPEWSLLGRIYPPPALASELLRSLQERAEALAEPSAGLGDAFPGFAEAWRKLKALPLDVAADPGPTFRSKIEWLDELRHNEGADVAEKPALARGLLEEVCLQMLLHNAGKAAVHPQALGEMGAALALWGDLLLAAGAENRRAAVEACALGVELAERANEEWSLGQAHWRAGSLLRRLGHGRLAEQFLHLAGFHFGLGSHTSCVIQLLGASAAILFDLGRFAECEALYLRQLRSLPPNATRHRFEALSSLSQLAQRAGRLKQAHGYLEAAEQQGASQGRSQALLEWKKAALLCELGESGPGARALGRACEALATLGAHADLVFALAELTEYHQALGKKDVLAALAEEAATVLPKLRGKLRCLLEDFAAAHRLPGGLPPGFFKKEKERLLKSGAVPAVETFGPGGLEAALQRAAPAEAPKQRRRRRRAA